MRSATGRQRITKAGRPTWLALALAMGLGACAANPWTPAPPPRQLVMPEAASLYKLDNGMRVLVAVDPGVDTVAIDVRHEAGSAADPPGKEGLAHLAEHLMFAIKPWGQEKPTVSAVLAAAALDTNAYTTWDYTHYRILGPAASTTLLAEVAAARLRFDCQHLSQEVFEREREVIRNELRTRLGNEGNRFQWRLHQAVYGSDHAYSRWHGGSESALDTITLDDVCGFISSRYRPETTIVVMAGAVTQEATKDLLARMKGIQARSGPAPVAGHDWTPAPAPVTLEADTERSRVMLIFALPPRHHRDELAARRIMSALVERAGDARPIFIAQVGMESMGGELAPVGALWASVEDAGDLQRARDFLAEQIAAFRKAKYTLLEHNERVAAHRFAEVYYAAEANQHDATLLFGLEPMYNRADVYADYVQFDRSNTFVAGELARNHALAVEDLQAAGERLLRSEPMVVYVRANPAIEEAYTSAALGAIGSTEEDLLSRLPVDPRLAGRPLELPPLRSRLGDARTFRLENGMEVVLLPSSTLPLVNVRLLFSSGSGQDPRDMGGLAEVAAGMAASGGQRQRQGSVTPFALSQIGSRYSHSVSYHGTTFTMRSAARYVDLLIQGLENHVRGKYSDARIAGFRKRMKKLLAEPDALQSARQNLALRAAIYGDDHPYASMAGMTAASIARIDAGLAERFQKEHYRAGDATIIVTGQFDPELVEKHIRFSFDDWKAGAAPDATAVGPHARPPGAVHLGIAQEDRLQTGIAMFYPTAPGIDGDHAARMVLARMLSLRTDAVREVLGASYGIHVSYAPDVGPGLLAITGDVTRARAGEAMRAVRDAIDGLRRGEDFDRDFVIARRRVARDLLIEAADAWSLGARLAFLATHDLPADFYERLARQVAAMKPDDVARVLARELAPAQETTLCVGAREDVQRAYGQAGITGFTIVD